MKTRYYIVDKLTYDRGVKICKAMRASNYDLDYVTFDEIKGIVEVTSKKDLRHNLAMACDIVGCVIRTEISRKQTKI